MAIADNGNTVTKSNTQDPRQINQNKARSAYGQGSFEVVWENSETQQRLIHGVEIAEDYYVDVGVANVYNLTPYQTRLSIAPIQYETGMRIRFRATNQNTSSSTINIAGVGSLTVYKDFGTTVLTGGEIKTTQDTIISIQNSASPSSSPIYYAKLELEHANQEAIATTNSNLATTNSNLATANTQITNLQNQLNIQSTKTVLGRTYVFKQIELQYVSTTSLSYTDGTFDPDDGSARQYISNGTINFTGLVGNTNYYIFAIYNPTTQISQMWYDVSYSSPALPTDFTKKKYIGACRTNASAQIISGKYMYGVGFYKFYYQTRLSDVTLGTPAVGTNNYPISIPQTPKIEAIILAMGNTGNAGTDRILVNFGSPDEIFNQTDEDFVDITSIGDAERTPKYDKNIYTTTGQIKIQIVESTGARNFAIFTRGWQEMI